MFPRNKIFHNLCPQDTENILHILSCFRTYLYKFNRIFICQSLSPRPANNPVFLQIDLVPDKY